MCTIKDKIFVIGGDTEKGLIEDPALLYYLEIRSGSQILYKQYHPVKYLQQKTYLPDQEMDHPNLLHNQHQWKLLQIMIPTATLVQYRLPVDPIDLTDHLVQIAL
ncbi:hypothetical protein BGZ65_004817 [Modicella reniformis]|uniref:Uncharacterized protein n=1 Tax=Modicella reniformis TaxID=1440133 RepID=A0A9P6IY18_9FUNG|nr:hypothetical protein BGZ65_004817 [Modicella reniformis]